MPAYGRFFISFFFCVWAQAASLPSWWTSLVHLQRMESHFVQTSDSAVFGSLSRSGDLVLAKGGRIRVCYESGTLFVSDGETLIQYDPGAKTAHRLDVHTAVLDMPLLNILINPASLEESFRILADGPERVRLEPKRIGLPKVEINGKGAFLRGLSWSDATGAKQVLVLQDPHVPPSVPPSTFVFKAPKGTRWLGQ